MNKTFSLSKKERLKSKKDIDTLFQQGKAFFVFPFKVHFLVVNENRGGAHAQIVCAVPKRKFKKATQRNTIRRRVKESYRLNKIEFVTFLHEKNKTIHLLFIYSHHEELQYFEIETAMKKIVKILEEKMAN